MSTRRSRNSIVVSSATKKNDDKNGTTSNTNVIIELENSIYDYFLWRSQQVQKLSSETDVTPVPPTTRWTSPRTASKNEVVATTTSTGKKRKNNSNNTGPASTSTSKSGGSKQSSSLLDDDDNNLGTKYERIINLLKDEFDYLKKTKQQQTKPKTPKRQKTITPKRGTKVKIDDDDDENDDTNNTNTPTVYFRWINYTKLETENISLQKQIISKQQNQQVSKVTKKTAVNTSKNNRNVKVKQEEEEDSDDEDDDDDNDSDDDDIDFDMEDLDDDDDVDDLLTPKKKKKGRKSLKDETEFLLLSDNSDDSDDDDDDDGIISKSVDDGDNDDDDVSSILDDTDLDVKIPIEFKQMMKLLQKENTISQRKVVALEAKLVRMENKCKSNEERFKEAIQHRITKVRQRCQQRIDKVIAKYRKRKEIKRNKRIDRRRRKTDRPYMKWDIRYQQLFEFYNEYGHCQLTKKICANTKYPSLWEFVKEIRKDHKKKSSRLTPDRVEKLNSIGFVWSIRNLQEQEKITFEHRVNQCLHYREQYGHLTIPPPPVFKPNSNNRSINDNNTNSESNNAEEIVTEEEKSFRLWARCMRVQYHRLRRLHNDDISQINNNKIPSKNIVVLNQYKIQTLNEVGFDWGDGTDIDIDVVMMEPDELLSAADILLPQDDSTNNNNNNDNEEFRNRLEQLKKVKKIYGTCHVDRILLHGVHPNDPTFLPWVDSQWELYHQWKNSGGEQQQEQEQVVSSSVLSDRFDILRRLGFDFDAKRKKQVMSSDYTTLKSTKRRRPSSATPKKKSNKKQGTPASKKGRKKKVSLDMSDDDDDSDSSLSLDDEDLSLSDDDDDDDDIDANGKDDYHSPAQNEHQYM